MRNITDKLCNCSVKGFNNIRDIRLTASQLMWSLLLEIDIS